jgi:DNA primase
VIHEDDVQAIRDRVDLVDLVTEHTQVKRVGRHWKALCPFHGEKTPSFSINREAGLYYCFGCGAKGDAVTFVREREHLGFVAAVERLAGRAGVTLRYTDPEQGEKRRRRDTLQAALADAVAWYHDRLLTHPDAEPARTYLTGRGVTADQIAAYQLGWAPPGWDTLARALDLPADVFTDAGLGRAARAGRMVDAFRERILFPIFDADGRPVGFGGRIMPGAEGPKYKNSAEGPLYTKSRVLYGLNWAKAPIVRTGSVIVCEGYTDVLGLAAAGIPTAVATCGTALTDDHVKTLTSYARRIVLGFDADTAGQGAAARFYEWEREHDIDVAVLTLPAGTDPADLARTDPDALRAAVDAARPFLAFRVERILDAADLSTPEGRARAAETALDAVREHPSDLVRDQYLMEVSARTRIAPERLRGHSGPRRARRPQPAQEKARERPLAGSEAEALRLLAVDPARIRPMLHAGLFADDRARAVFEALAGAGGLHEAIEAAPEPIGDLLRRVAVEDTDADPDDVVGLLLRAAVTRAIDGHRAELAADPDNDALFADYSVIVAAAKNQVEALDHPDPQERDLARVALLDWTNPDPVPADQ